MRLPILNLATSAPWYAKMKIAPKTVGLFESSVLADCHFIFVTIWVLFAAMVRFLAIGSGGSSVVFDLTNTLRLAIKGLRSLTLANSCYP